MPYSLYAYNGTTHANITPSAGDFTADGYNFCMLNGIVITNNGVDNPAYWDGGSTADLLPYDATNDWDDVNYAAKVIRSYKNFLFALSITDSGTTYEHMLHWSNPADVGDIPTDWDYTDTANEAGRVELSDTAGVLVDALPLHDSMIIYKEDAIHICNYIGGTFQFSFHKMSDAYGLLAQDCACQVQNRHFCVGRNFVYMHDGNTIEPILDKTNQDYFNATLDLDNYELTFVVFHKKRSEVWICYPFTGNDTCNKALIYNIKTGAQTFRDLPNLRYAVTGKIPDEQRTWADMTMTWPNEPATWSAGFQQPLTENLYGVSDDAIYKFDYGNQSDGVNTFCFAERRGIQVGGVEQVNTVTQIFPRMKATGTVQITVGSQGVCGDVIDWSDPVDFTPGTDSKVDVMVTGPLHAIRVSSEANIWWRLAGFEYNYADAGEI